VVFSWQGDGGIWWHGRDGCEVVPPISAIRGLMVLDPPSRWADLTPPSPNRSTHSNHAAVEHKGVVVGEVDVVRYDIKVLPSLLFMSSVGAGGATMVATGSAARVRQWGLGP
jgi:hypothetical protein